MKKKGDPAVCPEGTVRVRSNGIKQIKQNGKWVYIKKPKNEWVNRVPQEKINRIQSLFEDGVNYDEITKIVNCSKYTVTRYAKQSQKYFKGDWPPVRLPSHIRPTLFKYYYISEEGDAYREPRDIDRSGKYGEVNEWGLIYCTPSLRGNPYKKEKMYLSINIYFYDELTGKNIRGIKRSNHQLVAQAFIPNPHGYTEVLHGAKGHRCNHYTNLRWGTHAENMAETIGQRGKS